MTRYKNDPYPLSIRYKCKCSKCNGSLAIGTQAYYWPLEHKIISLTCGEEDFRQFLLSAQDEDFYNRPY
jgi:hypothetical protein